MWAPVLALPGQQEEGTQTTVWASRKAKDGTKGEGTCPVSAQQQSSSLTFHFPGVRPGQQQGIGARLLRPPCTSFGEWCLVAGVCADDSGRNGRRWKRPALLYPTLTPFQPQSLMQKVQEAPGLLSCVWQQLPLLGWGIGLALAGHQLRGLGLQAEADD